MENRSTWAKPKLVRKPVRETLGGTGSNQDGAFGEFPIQS